ncbi:hypothetical protein CEXT_128621 [Caerostris extrusa]|uniref:Uncharacterized protein n=1 Tax=Caerostris extrusa TaxID=172846 RepID=A0AAV4V7C9_CAEEX|nr:hypothetical protein CEXT_128621 [Caerostris extrusa]
MATVQAETLVNLNRNPSSPNGLALNSNISSGVIAEDAGWKAKLKLPPKDKRKKRHQMLQIRKEMNLKTSV